MKNIFLFLTALVALTNSISCNAKVKVEPCIQKSDVPRCILEKYPKNLRNPFSILTLGEVDLIEPNSKYLLKNLQGSLDETYHFLKSLGIDMKEDDATTALKKSNNHLLLAGLTLAVAAQTYANPYENNTVKKYLTSSKDEFLVSLTALKIWSELDVYSTWRSTETQPPGILAILNKIETSDQLNIKELQDILWHWMSTDEKNLKQTFYSKLNNEIPHLSNNEKAGLASIIARIFYDADTANSLMTEGGNNAENYDINGINVEIAIAQLNKAYNKKSAALLVTHAISPKETVSTSYKNRFENIPQALSKSEALAELKELAEGYLLAADNNRLSAKQRGNLYALASECFLLAHDKDSAIAVATKGLPYVKDAVFWQANDMNKGEPTPQNLARTAGGRGTEPVIALYSAGAIQQALDTHYLTEEDRYKYALEAGEKKDPTWLINHYWRQDNSDKSIHISRWDFTTNPSDSILKAAKAWYEKNPWATHEMEILFDIAKLSAYSGDKESMIAFLKAAAKQADQEKESDFYAEELAQNWKIDERILLYIESHPSSQKVM